jgi:hypothetical protein
MTPFDLTPSLTTKGFFRFTGPPEHWLTAVKYMTWGLEEKYRKGWERIQPGDVFFIHSTHNSFFDNARSGIIGIGIVGSNFSIKNNHLWLYEQQHKENRWPLLVPLSEIYLFSRLPDVSTWQSPDLTNESKTKSLIDQLLKEAIPLSTIHGFPQMGSFSGVSMEVANQILFDKRPLHEYSSEISIEGDISASREMRLEKVKSIAESFRYADTLKVFDSIKQRIVSEAPGVYGKNNELLAKAEEVHCNILQQLLVIFQKKGYDVRNNSHVDLFAHDGKRAFLIEVKSTENRNFRSQARKGLAQLLEYDYFEVNKFVQEEKLSLKDKYRIIIPSQMPKDNNYVGFLNNLNVGIGVVNQDIIKPVGEDFGFSKV